MTSIKGQIKNTIIEFISDFENIIDGGNLKNDIGMANIYFHGLSDTEITQHVIQHILPKKSYISARDMNFFRQNKKTLFGDLPERSVNEFEKVLFDGSIPQENIDVIWDYFDTLVALAEKAKKVN